MLKTYKQVFQINDELGFRQGKSWKNDIGEWTLYERGVLKQ